MLDDRRSLPSPLTCSWRIKKNEFLLCVIFSVPAGLDETVYKQIQTLLYVAFSPSISFLPPQLITKSVLLRDKHRC